MIKKGLQRIVLVLSLATPLSAGNFSEELLLYEQRVKNSSHESCTARVTIKELVSPDIKDFYEKRGGRKWYDELSAIHTYVQKDFHENFGICLDIIQLEEWKHPPTEKTHILLEDAKFVRPGESQLVIALAKETFGFTGHADRYRNHLVVALDTENYLSERTIQHELGHMFGADHVDQKSIMAAKLSSESNIGWDKENKQKIIAQRQRKWDIHEDDAGLYATIDRLLKEDIERLKEVHYQRGHIQMDIYTKNRTTSSTLTRVINENILLRHTLMEYLTRDLLQRYPQEGHFHFQLGQVYAAKDNYPKAIAAFEEAHKRGTRYAALENDLAYCYIETHQNYARALELAQSAIIKEPWQEGFIDTVGWAYYHNGRYAEAERELLKIKTKTIVDLPDYQWHLGLTYHKLGKKMQAKEAFKKVIAHDTEGVYRKQAEEKIKEYEK